MNQDYQVESVVGTSNLVGKLIAVFANNHFILKGIVREDTKEFFIFQPMGHILYKSKDYTVYVMEKVDV